MRTEEEKTEIITKEGYLNWLYYDVGKQACELEVTTLIKKENGEVKPTKWLKFPDVQGNAELLSKVNNRTILKNEIVIDLDPRKNETQEELKIRYEKVLQELNNEGLNYCAYFSVSRGYHINLFFPQLLFYLETKVKDYKLFFIEKYGGDLQKASNRCMIAIEFAPHWKTGKQKELLTNKGDGINERLPFREEWQEKSKDSEISKLLNEPEVCYSYLDLGCVEDIWYFGFVLDGKDAIITSEGNILHGEQIKNLFNYRSSLGDIAPLISKKTVKKFYSKQNSDLNLINPKELYKHVRDKIRFYMDFSGKDEIADVLTCWIIGTYCYTLFYWFPHILINAPSGSGKTKCAKIVIYLSFRGFELNAAAGLKPAQIVRSIEGNRGTIFVDEYERVEGVNNESLQLCNQIFNASAERDAYIIVNEPVGKTWKPRKFPIYCPKITSNISGINPTSLSRFVAFKWLKTNSPKGKLKPQKHQDKESFAPISEDLYILILKNWKKIKAIYDALDIPELKNREEDNWLPLLAIAKFVDSCEGGEVNAEKQIWKYIADYQDIEVETGDETAEFFKIVLENVKESRYYTPKEIALWADISELLSRLKSPAHWIGKKLRLFQFKFSKGGGVRKYFLTQEGVKKIVDTYYPEQTPHNDTTPHKEQTTQKDLTDTQRHKQHITTQNVALGGVCGVTPQSEIEEIKDINDREELLDYIDKNDAEGSGISEQLLADNCSKGESWLKETLSSLSSKGDVFECRAGFWKRLK